MPLPHIKWGMGKGGIDDWIELEAWVNGPTLIDGFLFSFNSMPSFLFLFLFL